MPDETVAIPVNDADARLSVRVIALHRGKEAGAFAYLQGMRTGALKAVKADPEDAEVAKAYHRNEKRYFGMMADAVPTGADAVVSPPSRMAWQAEPYRQAILGRNAKIVDLTPQLARTGNTFAGEGSVTVQAVAAGMSYTPTGQESKIRRLVTSMTHSRPAPRQPQLSKCFAATGFQKSARLSSRARYGLTPRAKFLAETRRL